MYYLLSIALILLSILYSATSSVLIFSLPNHLPSLPSSTRAILTTTGTTHTALLTRTNTFVFNNLTGPASYLLDIACRDYDFVPLKVEVKKRGAVEVWRGRNGQRRERLSEAADKSVELRVGKRRDFYEERVGFSPLSLLKNPMILMAVVGFGFVVGMPYLLDSMDPEMKKEFEEQQKNSVFSGAAAGSNPLQNFDMAAWMAGKTAVASGGGSGSGSGSGREKEEGDSRVRSRRRG